MVKDEFDIPIIGVVEPGARAALAVTENKKIGVIGTEATVRSSMYEKIIQEINPEVSVIDFGLYTLSAIAFQDS